MTRRDSSEWEDGSFSVRHERTTEIAFGVIVTPEVVAAGKAIAAGAGIYRAAREHGISSRTAAKVARALLPIIGPDCACGKARFHGGQCAPTMRPCKACDRPTPTVFCGRECRDARWGKRRT